MYYVYAISSVQRKYIYVGLTDSIDRRFEQHALGFEQTTKPYRSFELIFLTTTDDRSDARFLEKYLKSGIGKEFLKQLKSRDGEIGRHERLKIS